MKLYMIGHEKCDLLIQVTACAGLTVSDNLNKKAIRLFQIISIPSKVCYFRLSDHVILMNVRHGTSGVNVHNEKSNRYAVF